MCCRENRFRWDTKVQLLVKTYRSFFDVCRAYMNDIFRISTVKNERGLSYPFARSVSFSLGVTF